MNKAKEIELLHITIKEVIEVMATMNSRITALEVAVGELKDNEDNDER